MKNHRVIFLLAAGLIAGCGKEEPPAKQTPPPATSSGNPVTAPLDYIAAAGKAQQSAVKQIDTAAINSAIQLFNVQEGRNPKDLNELVPVYISRLPAAPYGMKFDYDPTQGKVKVVKQ